MKNKLLLEIVIILVFSIAVAIAYNYTLPQPLSFVYEKKIIPQLEDDILFGDSDKLSDVDESSSNSDGLQDKNAISGEKNSSEDIAKEEKLATEEEKINDEVSSKGKTVTYKQILRILDNTSGDFLLIDARNEENWSKKHIGNAINIFPYDPEEVVIPKILDLPHNKKIIVYCDGGNCDASHKLAEMMMNFGLDNVFIYTGGWEDWTKQQGIKD